jgi:hypothetical protein
MKKEDKLIDELIDKLIKSPTDPGEIHICPICNGKIHILFGAYKRGEESLLGVLVKCESCGVQMATDYTMPQSPWLDVK